MKTKVLSCRIPEQLHQELYAVCRKYDMSPSRLITSLISENLAYEARLISIARARGVSAILNSIIELMPQVKAELRELEALDNIGEVPGQMNLPLSVENGM